MPEEWYVGTGYMAIDGGYELEIDNILDLSHIEFLHPLFASEAVSRSEIRCSQDGEAVWSRRYIRGDTPPPFIYEAFNIPPGNLVDRWLDVRWHAPALMALWTGGVVADQPKDSGVNVPSAHLFTPESASRTHYFYAMSFPRALGPAGEAMARDNVRGTKTALRARGQADHRGRGPVHGRRGVLVSQARPAHAGTRQPSVLGASSASASPLSRARPDRSIADAMYAIATSAFPLVAGMPSDTGVRHTGGAPSIGGNREKVHHCRDGGPGSHFDRSSARPGR